MFSKPQLVDPTFGALTLSKHGWSGEARWLDGTRVLVSVERDRTGPREADRVAFDGLTANYAVLVPELRGALFALWQPELDVGHWGDSAPSTAEALWRIVTLDSVTVRADGRLELLFGFAGDFWPDAAFAVEVKGSSVRPLSLDD